MTKQRFQHLKILKYDDVPKQGGGGKVSKIRSMSFWPEFQSSLTEMAVAGTTPYEAAGIDLTNYKKEFEKAKIKKPMLAVLSTLRSLLKDLKIEKKIELIRRGDDQIYVRIPK